MLIQQNISYEQYANMQRGTSPLNLHEGLALNMRLGTIFITLHDDLILGRNAENAPSRFVDLSKFGALSAGVSRRHLYLVRHHNGQVLVGDLGSSNGTYLNEDRLLPEQLYPLDNGDVLRLGTLIIHVLFE